ncbi:MAG TPA: hypothetical protein VIP75_08045, partial [Acidothermales bacterium]
MVEHDTTHVGCRRGCWWLGSAAKWLVRPQPLDVLRVVHIFGFRARALSDRSFRLGHMFERLVQVRGQLAELVTALDPDALTGQTA